MSLLSSFVAPASLVTQRRRSSCAQRRRPRIPRCSTPAVPTPPISGTPCFTPRVSVSPMSYPDRLSYLCALSEAFDLFLSSGDALGSADLLVPQLDTSSDVYDQRFMLQVAWACAQISASERRLRTLLLVQASAPNGSIPVSVSGLFRNLSADWAKSKDNWPPDVLHLAQLDSLTEISEYDVAIIISPTNAVDTPTILDVQNAVQRRENTRVVLLNARLADVPGPSNVMRVKGRSERIQLLQSFRTFFCCKLLYTEGTVYPVQGILYTCGGRWQVWRAEIDEQDYELIAEYDSKPDPTTITEAFRVSRMKRERAALALENSLNPTPNVQVYVLAAVTAIAAVVGAHEAGLF